MKILFILKRNNCYGFKTYTRRSSGLWNSTRFIVEALAHYPGIQPKIVEVIDNNCIDREVKAFQPDLVVIEALWVVPEKFDVLKKLHPKVKWFCHMHSGIPFLALEGIATEWLRAYQEKGVGIIANSLDSYHAFKAFLDGVVVYLPNVYVMHKPKKAERDHDFFLEVACFGAIRPMKNQLLQAMAAIKVATEQGKVLRFHINSSRVEVGGQPVLKNLRNLFHNLEMGVLVEHPWYEPEDCLEMLTSFDIGMQVSMTETFNVVGADYVTAGLPVVFSKEVAWSSRWSQADEASIEDIAKKMRRALRWKCIKWMNRHLLKRAVHKAAEMWAEFCYEENKPEVGSCNSLGEDIPD